MITAPLGANTPPLPDVDPRDVEALLIMREALNRYLVLDHR